MNDAEPKKIDRINDEDHFIALAPCLEKIVATGNTKAEAKMRAIAAGCSTPVVIRRKEK